MTPFGEHMNRMRRARGISQRDMAAALGVSPAYLSALEHGHRGRPPWPMVQKIIGFFNVIWDEAEEIERLAGLSDTRVRLVTEGLAPEAVALANRLAAGFSALSDEDRADIAAILDAGERRLQGGRG